MSFSRAKQNTTLSLVGRVLIDGRSEHPQVAGLTALACRSNAMLMTFKTSTTLHAGHPKTKKWLVKKDTQCEAFSNPGKGLECHYGDVNDEKTPQNAMDTGGCGLTKDGKIFAYHRDPSAFCKNKNPHCGWKVGPTVSHGSSEVTFGSAEKMPAAALPDVFIGCYIVPYRPVSATRGRSCNSVLPFAGRLRRVRLHDEVRADDEH